MGVVGNTQKGKFYNLLFFSDLSLKYFFVLTKVITNHQKIILHEILMGLVT